MVMYKNVNGQQVLLTTAEETARTTESTNNATARTAFIASDGYLSNRRAQYMSKAKQLEAIYAYIKDKRDRGNILPPVTDTWVTQEYATDIKYPPPGGMPAVSIKQPAFSAKLFRNENNVTGAGLNYYLGRSPSYWSKFYDTTGSLSVDTGRYIVPITGNYDFAITLEALVGASASDGSWSGKIYLNAGNIQWTGEEFSFVHLASEIETPTFTFHLSASVHLTVGAIVEGVFQISGMASNLVQVYGAGTTFSGHLINEI